mmetsp:Transcript_404/g.462  ORF Transcript_404/g.462 Transcript_404/m.462 type:complete len:86 (+) Transcript_404:1309-1566(+)
MPFPIIEYRMILATGGAAVIAHNNTTKGHHFDTPKQYLSLGLHPASAFRFASIHGQIKGASKIWKKSCTNITKELLEACSFCAFL